jgi:oxygen-dependent protoporphyrinogen oxidase
MTARQRIVILGGGISGLSAAYYLSRNFRNAGVVPDITLIEAGQKFGGVIESIHGDGFLLEGGPDSFISEKPAALELCRELGIESEVIGTRPENQRSYVFTQGKLHRIPEGFYLVAPVKVKTLFELPFISWPGRLRMACEPLVPRWRGPGDESIGHFIRRRFGSETLEKIGQPMMSAMYGGDVDRLSLEAAFPRFKIMEEKHRSIVFALRAGMKKKTTSGAAEQTASGPRYSLFLTLKSGLDVVVRTLCDRISPAVKMLSGTPAVYLKPNNGCWVVGLADGRILNADKVCVSLPAPAAANLFKQYQPDLAGLLSGIQYESVVTVNMVFRKQDIPLTIGGFGFVVPVTEKRNVIGCTFSTLKFQSRTREDFFALRLFLGGSQNPRLYELSDLAIEMIAREELKVTTGITVPPENLFINRYPSAMPQYQVGHLDRVATIEKTAAQYPGLFLTGNAYRGLGIPDCIRQARETAERMI